MKFTLVLLIVQSSGLEATDCRCGETQNKNKYFDLKVDRGEEAGINEFPWAALLKIRNYSRPGFQYHRCGGTLVNDRYVLTAAHCVPEPYGFSVEVGLGEHRISTSLDSKELKMNAVPPFIVHDRYEENKRSGYVIYDFTLLRLSSRVRFSSYPNIRPICLPSNSFQDYDEETAGVVAGWGFTRIRHITIGDLMRGLGSFASDTLQKLSVRMVTQAQCQDIYRDVENVAVQIRNINMCAASTVGDTCQGDSGGPLMVWRNRYFEIVGVISFGIGCSSTHKGKPLPGVYARVSLVIDWIKSKTHDGAFCDLPVPNSSKGNPIRISEQEVVEAVDSWNAWGAFSACSTGCGIGKKTRDRSCSGKACGPRGHTQQTQERVCRGKRCWG